MKSKLYVYKSNINEINAFIKIVENAGSILKSNEKLTEKDVNQIENNAKQQVQIFTNRLISVINSTFNISSSSLEVAEDIIKSLKLNGEVKKYKGLKGFIFKKIKSESIGIGKKFIPYFGELIDVITNLNVEGINISDAKLDEKVVIDLRMIWWNVVKFWP